MFYITNTLRLHIFDFQIIQSQKCMSCGGCLNNFEICNQLQLNVYQKCSTLDQLLNDYFRNTNFLEANCRFCHHQTVIRKREKLDTFPLYLSIKMNYNSFEQMQSSEIQIPIYTEISLSYGPKQKYILVGVIYYSNYFGNGHYWSLTFKRNKFRLHNDMRSCVIKRKAPRENNIHTIIYRKYFE